jgi:acetylglutamate kinase
MKTVVIKYGGAAMQTPELMQAMMQDIAGLKSLGMHPIVVHGGGAEISNLCQKMGIIPQFVDGLRITDSQTMQIVQMVLVGKINKELVSHLNQKDAKAIGLSGQDGNLLLAAKLTHSSGIDLGFVGQVTQVNPKILQTLIQAGYIPVIAPIAASAQTLGFNINADSAASHIARALKADHLIFLTDVPGVLSNPQDFTTKIETIKSHEVKTLIASGKLSKGMIPKVEAALAALKEGVGEVHILDGRVAHSLLLHFQGAERMGTTFK